MDPPQGCDSLCNAPPDILQDGAPTELSTSCGSVDSVYHTFAGAMRSLPRNELPYHVIRQDFTLDDMPKYHFIQGYRRHDQSFTVPRICVLHRQTEAHKEVSGSRTDLDGKSNDEWQIAVAVALLKKAGRICDTETARSAIANGELLPPQC